MSSTERTDSTTRVRSLVPLAHVKNVSRSAGFYRKLGFSVENSFVPPDAAEPVWAWLESDGAQLMLALANEPVIAAQQAVLFYVYCDNVAEMSRILERAGIMVGAIQYPFYAPQGEFRVEDSDGYVLMVTHT
jgi:hypothetical protein